MPLQNFGTLAQRYYPDKTYRTATRLFRRELEVTKGLLRALKRGGVFTHQSLAYQYAGEGD